MGIVKEAIRYWEEGDFPNHGQGTYIVTTASNACGEDAMQLVDWSLLGLTLDKSTRDVKY